MGKQLFLVAFIQLTFTITSATYFLPPGGLEVDSQRPIQPAQLPDVSQVNPCKLPAPAFFRDLGEGFSDSAKRSLAPSTGILKTALFFVDFPDAPANDTTQSLYDKLVPGAIDWFYTSSYGKLNLTVDADMSKFHRMPQPSTAYGWKRSGANMGMYIRDAITAIGTSYKFEPSSVLYIVPTKKAEEISFSPTSMSPLVMKDGTRMGSCVTFGQDLHWKWGFKVLNHETGHTMGLPDLYPSDMLKLPVGAWVGGFDMMGLINGTSPELFAWHKWKFDWIDDNQVDCITGPGTTEHTLAPIEVPGGVKMAAIKLSATTALALEVRSNLGQDVGSCSKGLLAYVVNTATSNWRGPPIAVIDGHPGLEGCHLNRGGRLNGAPIDFEKEKVFDISKYGVKVSLNSVESDSYKMTVTYGTPEEASAEEEER